MLFVEVQERMPTGYAGRETSHNSGPLNEKSMGNLYFKSK